MKVYFCLIILISVISSLFAVGVVINKNVTVLQPILLRTCHYDVAIQNQVAAVTVSEIFRNTFNSVVEPRYSFPLPSGASATQLRWFVHGEWHLASIAGNPPSLPGGPSSIPDYYKLYIGFFPVTFDFGTTLEANEDIRVELTYVQLLNYSVGTVNLFLKNDYTPIQQQPLVLQELDINLQSDRAIQSFALNQPAANIEFNSESGFAHFELANSIASSNYSLNYSLAQSEIGFRAMSTVRDSVPDSFGNGFFTFIVEPGNVQTRPLPIRIALIVDHSGSMNTENRITQARQAMIYIINHLSADDRFNVIAFDHEIQHIWSSHQEVSLTNITTATNWINNISAVAPNGTNISGALDEAINEFIASPSSSYRNVIIMITDGGPTVGITDTYQLVNHVHSLVSSHDLSLALFNFGVGSDVNTQLLNLLAQDNNGTAVFLGSSDLFTTVTSFFNLISQAVILDPTLSVTPNNALTEIYPDPLPSLYHDSQLIITGRYNTGQNITLHFDGNDANGPVSYPYEATLTTNNDSLMQFIPKLWASKKIDQLLVEYYSYPTDSAQAMEMKEAIINLSLAYGVVCVFTSFSGDTEIDDNIAIHITQPIRLLGNFPNPFNPETAIRFSVLTDMKAPVFMEIYNIKGQLVRNLASRVDGKGEYGVYWNGKDNLEKQAVSGIYFYKIQIGKYLLTGKMIMLK